MGRGQSDRSDGVSGLRGARRGDLRAPLGVAQRQHVARDRIRTHLCQRRGVCGLKIARGSRVVFNVAGTCGYGALEAAKQKGVYGVGVDAGDILPMAA